MKTLVIPVSYLVKKVWFSDPDFSVSSLLEIYISSHAFYHLLLITSIRSKARNFASNSSQEKKFGLYISIANVQLNYSSNNKINLFLS